MATGTYDWKKNEKNLYGTSVEPVELTLGTFGFFCIAGQGSPDGQAFQDAVEALYALSYGVRMSYKSGTQPAGFYEYAVYPLEGIWDLGGKSGEAVELAHREKRPQPAFDRNDLIYRLMIRQPDFVDAGYAAGLIQAVMAKKSLPTLALAQFETITEGRCAQILHQGPYADEPASFHKLDEFCRKQSLARIGHTHREIYLTDARKTAPEKLRTILRFPVRDDFRCL